jgi:two-component system response regulator MtrA
MTDAIQTVRKRIVAVDDEEEILRLYQAFLQSRDFSVVTCRNATDALTYLRVERADLALLDIDMPGINGIRLLEMIRLNASMDAMRVVMVTAKRDEETVRACMKAGCDGFLVKPFSLKDFASRVALELFEVSDDDVHGMLRKGLSAMKSGLLREPGLQEYDTLQWDPYPLVWNDVRICMLLPRGVRPTHFQKTPDEAEHRIVVLYRHPLGWKRVWPAKKPRTAA